MSQETSGSDFQGRCKSVMNVIRRALSFTNKRPTSKEGAEDSAASSIEMQPVTTAKPRIDSLPNSDVPSTSASCSHVRAPTVYEDPFVAVAADGTIYIKHYYNFHNRAEFHIEQIRYPQVRRNSRVLQAKEIVKIYYAPGVDCKDETICKSWGICMNNVWWASHLNRMEGGNPYTNVVLMDDNVVHAGFSVSNIDAFAESLQCVGLPTDAPFQSGLPNPPLSMMKIPFIDEDEDEAPKKRKTRRSLSKANKSQ